MSNIIDKIENIKGKDKQKLLIKLFETLFYFKSNKEKEREKRENKNNENYISCIVGEDNCIYSLMYLLKIEYINIYMLSCNEINNILSIINNILIK